MAWINPTTRDLVLTTSRDVTRPANPTLDHVWMRLHTHRGTCFWDLTFGSTLHLLPTAKMSASIERDAEDRARVALQPMVAAGEIRDLAVKATRADRSRLELIGSCRDAARRPLLFSTWVAV